MSGQALAVLENLEKASATELETLASALFTGEYALVSSDKAPLSGRRFRSTGRRWRP